MGGQVDRFGQPIPASPGYQTILNPDGTQPRMRNILRLGTGITATDDPNSDATDLNVDISIGGSVTTVDGVSNLRNDLFLLGPSVDKIYVTKYYGATPDAGGMPYRWNATDVTTDDGVLHIKNSHYSTGRFNPIRPIDGMMPAQACGPALADIGTRTVSFDPNGVIPIREEFYRVTKILRNNGYDGLYFGPKYDGTPASYFVYGDEKIGTSVKPFVGFEIRTAANSEIYCTDARAFQGSAQLTVQIDTEIVNYGAGYGTRFWTYGTGGLADTSGRRTANGVADITGLAVGDTVYVRLGANNTDYDGSCMCYAFCTIKTLTPTTGTAGNIEFWQGFPEDCPDVPPNPLRLYNKHDILKINGFQDNTRFNCTFRNVYLGVIGYRQLILDCVWTETRLFAINGLTGIGMQGRVKVLNCHAPSSLNGTLVTCAFQYATHISDLQVSITNETPGTIMQIWSEEANCRGTRVDKCTVECFDSNTGFGGFTNLFSQTVGQTSPISVGHCIISGGLGTIGLGGDIELLDIKNGTLGSLNTQVSTIKAIVYKNKKYVLAEDGFYDFPLIASSTLVYPLPIHGITKSLRAKPDTMTGVTKIEISDTGAGWIDITSEFAAGTWQSLPACEQILSGYPDWYGYNTMSFRFTTDGTVPAGKGVHFQHVCFIIDQANSALTGTDTSFALTQFSSGAPTANAEWFGQTAFDTTNSVWYKSVATGTGASDWKPAGAGGAIQASTRALGSINYAKIAAPSIPSGTIALYADSTSGAITGKDQFGIVSVQPIITTAVSHKWLSDLSASGVFGMTQPSSLDLSDLAAVALTNADATIAVGGGSYYQLPASTLTGLHTLTLGNTGATDKQAIQVRAFSQGSNYLINDSAATLLLSVASGTKVVATFVWNTGTGKFQLQSWNFFT